MSKVVSLHGADIGEAGKPLNHAAIAYVEHLLAQLKAGQVTDIAVASVTASEEIQTVIHFNTEKHKLGYACGALFHRFHAIAYATSYDVKEPGAEE